MGTSRSREVLALRAVIREQHLHSSSRGDILLESFTSKAVKEISHYVIGAASEYGIGAAGGALTLPVGAEGAAAGPVVETVIDSMYAADSVKSAVESIANVKSMAGDYSSLLKGAYEAYDPGNWKGFYTALKMLVKKVIKTFNSLEKSVDKIAKEIKEVLQTIIDTIIEPIKQAIQFVIPDATIGIATAKAVEGALKALTENAYTYATATIDKIGFLKRFVADPATAQEFFESVIVQLIDIMRDVADKIDKTSNKQAFLAGGLLSIAGGPGGMLAAAIAKGFGPKILRKTADALEKYMPNMLDLIDKILRVIIPFMFTCLALFQIMMRGDYKDSRSSEVSESYRQIRIHNLRKNVRKVLYEEKNKPGTEKVDAKGSLNVKKIADTLGVDAAALSNAVKSSKAGKKRTPAHNAVLGDVFVKLMNASPEDTVKAMNAFKAVSSEKESKTDKK